MGNDTNKEKENSQTFVKEFLLAEYNSMRDAFWKNEQTGETRVNWFIGIVSAAAAGMVSLLTAENGLEREQLHIIIIAVLFSLLVFGIVTLFRIIQRNKKTDEYKRACDDIRQIFKNNFADGILKDYNPFKNGTRKFGGLADLVSAINALIAAALIFVIYDNFNLNAICYCKWVLLLWGIPFCLMFFMSRNL